MPPQDLSPPSTTSDSNVRPPQQARSRRTLERLEKAALELVARDGPDSVTVAQVVARARSSVGSFYARFQGKDELFLHLAEGLRRQALERWGALDVASAPEPVAATVGFLVEDEVQGGGRRRELLAHGDSGAEGGEFTQVVAGDLHRGLAGKGGEGPSLERVTLAVRVVRASLAAMVAASPSGRAPGTAADGGEPVDPAALRPVLEAVVRVVLRGGGVATAVVGESVGQAAVEEAAPATPEPDPEDAPVPDEAPAPVPDESREPVVEGEVEEVEEAEEPEEAGLDLPEAPLEDESTPVDPFDVWG
jgi:AcrR family transcriptional regulator